MLWLNSRVASSMSMTFAIMLTLAFLSPTPAFSQENVPAKQIGGIFQCKAQAEFTTSTPGAAPAKSVKLYVDTGPASGPWCVDLTDDIVTIDFSLPFDPAHPYPELRALAYSEPGCPDTALISIPSPNACVVTFTIAPPVFVP